MTRRLRAVLSVTFLTAGALVGTGGRTTADGQSSAAASGIDWRAVEAAMGRTGAMQPGDNYRFNLPRSDLLVTSDGVRIRPSFALGSWVAFKQSGANEAVAMGDLVLTEMELNPVLARLQEGGVGQTAVHKHLLNMTPPIWWAHIHAHGDPVQIARAVREALTLTGTPPRKDRQPHRRNSLSTPHKSAAFSASAAAITAASTT